MPQSAFAIPTFSELLVLCFLMLHRIAMLHRIVCRIVSLGYRHMAIHCKKPSFNVNRGMRVRVQSLEARNEKIIIHDTKLAMQVDPLETTGEF